MKDPYVYEGSSILINLKDIRDQKKLDEYENAMTSLAIMKLQKDGMEVNSLNDVFAVHKMLFEKVYSWAGEPRQINIYKEEPVLSGLSVEYCDYKKIRQEIKKLDKEFVSLDWKKLSKKKLVSNTAFYFTFLWKIHPFREGNTRTVSTMMSLYAKKIGLKLDVDFVAEHVKYFRNAMVLNSIGEYAEPEHLEEFLSDALLIRNPKDSTEKYKTINGYEVEKYRYAQHSSKD